jgi:hypothetical protein
MAAGRMSDQSRIMIGFMPTDLEWRRGRSCQPSSKRRLHCGGLQSNPAPPNALKASWRSEMLFLEADQGGHGAEGDVTGCHPVEFDVDPHAEGEAVTPFRSSVELYFWSWSRTSCVSCGCSAKPGRSPFRVWSCFFVATTGGDNPSVEMIPHEARGSRAAFWPSTGFSSTRTMVTFEGYRILEVLSS